MKRIFAIAMLVVLMFNIGGYALLFEYLIKRSDAFANEQIAKGLYKPDELVEVKIPVDLPNIQPQSDFQAISGQIKLSDADYNYVALKLTRDTMFVMCIPNYEKTRLIEENVITAKQVSDYPLTKKNHVPVSKKAGMDNDYNFPLTLFDMGTAEYQTYAHAVCGEPKVLTHHLSLPSQPPEMQNNLA